MQLQRDFLLRMLQHASSCNAAYLRAANLPSQPVVTDSVVNRIEAVLRLHGEKLHSA